MIDNSLLEILCCPETKQDVEIADESIIEKINQKIKIHELKNRAGVSVEQPIDGGLIRSDKLFLYPIREDIPIMLIDEAIPLENMI